MCAHNILGVKCTKRAEEKEMEGGGGAIKEKDIIRKPTTEQKKLIDWQVKTDGKNDRKIDTKMKEQCGESESRRRQTGVTETDRQGTLRVRTLAWESSAAFQSAWGASGPFPPSLYPSLLLFPLSPFDRLRPEFHMSMRDRDREGEEEREAQHSFIRPVPGCRCNKRAIEGDPALKVEVYV